MYIYIYLSSMALNRHTVFSSYTVGEQTTKI